MMENLKVKVNNEAESKEVIFLGEQLGYVRPHPPSCISMKNGGYVCLGFNYDGVQEDLILLVGGFKESDMNDIKDYKELTIPQLRDLVVLKRNSIDDATHKDQDNWKWYIGADSYVWQAGNAQQLKQWDKSSLDYVDLKPIEKPMKEFLVNHDSKWTLQLLDSDTEENSYRVAVPSGAEIYVYFDEFNRFNFYKENYSAVWQDDDYWDYDMDEYKKYCKKYGEILWQRSEAESLNDQYAEIEQVRQDTVKVTVDELKHRVYKKDVSHLDSIDVYRVLELFNVQSHAVGHAIKKLLCSGGRGAKDEAQDIQEAIDSLIRYQEMKNEDS